MLSAVNVVNEWRVSHLHARLGEVDLQRELLSCVNVRVVSLREHALQFFELRAGESGPNAPLLPLLVQSSVVGEELVGNCSDKTWAKSCVQV